MKTESSIRIKSEEEIKILREAGKILAGIIEEVTRSLKPGIQTLEIDKIAEKLIHDRGVKPAFKGYRGYPNCVCISINEEVVHGIPSKRVLKEGDIASLDIGIIHNNYYSDTAVTIPVGNINDDLKRLLQIAESALLKGIEEAREGNRLSDISHAVQEYVEANNFSVVREFVGHGIGKNLHEEPEIPNFGPANQGPFLKEGMVFAIEPMVNLGAWQTRIREDGWTVVTADGKPSAHFEHSIVIRRNGPEILTTLYG